MLSVDYLEREGISHGEYYALLLLTTSGMMIMAAATDLIAVFLGLEVLSISLYILSGYARDAVLGDVLTAAHTCFLQKPYSPDELAQAVRATLGDGIDLPAPPTDPG